MAASSQINYLLFFIPSLRGEFSSPQEDLL